MTELHIDKINEIFNLIKNGRKIKNVSEGIIINNVELDKSTIFCISFVSQYTQSKAKKVVKGIDTINPAKSEDLLATSATVTTTIAVIKVLIRKYNISSVYAFSKLNTIISITPY